jgi:tripartite-type tricarboxylate transporter receptor subunit TctC
MNRRPFLAAAVLAALLGSPFASAQAPYPSRPITMIVPFPAGGLADIVARPVAEAMSRDLGQPVVIENRGGAGGGIGMAAASKAAPDGYTILMALSSFSVLPEADVILGRAPMYTFGSLRPIARYTADPTVLAVRAEAPWKTAKDFVDFAKANPGRINYGSSGNYGTMHVPMEILAQDAGIRMTHVPFTGAAPAVVALLGGQIDAISTGPATVLQHVKAGKIRVLAHWGAARLDALPDVPTLKEAGYQAEYAQWSGLFIPSGTPEPIAQRLRAAARVAANDAKVKDVILNAGSPVLYQDTPEFEKYVAADVQRMSEVVKKIGKVQ